MIFPKDKIGHSYVYQGNKSEEGWLILNIGNVELDGVNKIYIALDDVQSIKDKASKQSDESQRIRELFSVNTDE